MLAVQEKAVTPQLDHVEMYTMRGLVTLLWHGPRDAHDVVLMCGGAMGGLLGPADGLFHDLGVTFAEPGHRHHPGRLPAPQRPRPLRDRRGRRGRRGRAGSAPDRFVVVGHSFGGAVAINTGVALGRHAAGVVALSTQSAGCESADLLDDSPLLLVHGDADELLPPMASEIVRMIAGHGELDHPPRRRPPPARGRRGAARAGWARGSPTASHSVPPMADPDEHAAGRMVGAERAAELQAAARDWPSWSLTERQLADLELIMNGAFAPLPGFLGERDHATVVAAGHLDDGTAWPAPVTLDVTADVADQAGAAGHLALRDPEGVLLAVLEVTDRFRPDVAAEAEALFATADAGHPGADWLLRHTRPDRLGGPVLGVELPTHWSFTDQRLTPAAVRTRLEAAGAGHVAGFATADPPLSDDLDALRAAAAAGATLVVAVSTGPGAGAFDPYTVMRSWHAAADRLPDSTVLGVVPLARRGDDRLDAALSEVVLRNHGVTDMIPPAATDRWSSAVALRQRLDRGADLPDGAVVAEVEAELRASYPPLDQRGLTVFMTGFSGSGKSTVAQALAARLRERGGRSVTLLDGDLVRHHLSSELGFSREHRDLNIRRIGFVAAEITRAGGVAICAPIAPYDGVRRDVRAMVEDAGGFVLVHISTPLEVCEARDRKGLYAKARAGLIGEFTGISDPYEVPTDAEITLDTTDIDVDEAVGRIVEHLTDAGYLAPETGHGNPSG